MNNPYLTTTWAVSLTAASTLGRIGSALPLIRFRPTDKVKYTDLLITGSVFENINSYEDLGNNDFNMFFEIDATGEIYE